MMEIYAKFYVICYRRLKFINVAPTKRSFSFFYCFSIIARSLKIMVYLFYIIVSVTTDHNKQLISVLNC